MIFIPSIKGISHHWAEGHQEEDMALCCQVLADRRIDLKGKGADEGDSPRRMIARAHSRTGLPAEEFPPPPPTAPRKYLQVFSSVT